MPTYEYACKACGEHLEVVQSFKDSALTECPACGGPLRKVFGNIGVTFKGSGFYKTDSRSETGRGAHKAAEPKPADSGRRHQVRRLEVRRLQVRRLQVRRLQVRGLRCQAAVPQQSEQSSGSSSEGRGRLVGTSAGLPFQTPLIDISEMARVTPAAWDGNHSRSLPIATTPSSIRWMLDAIVASLTGAPSSPSRNNKPSAPTEKSPLTGLTPECRPLTDCTRSPSPILASTSAALSSPGSRYMARVPTPGALL